MIRLNEQAELALRSMLYKNELGAGDGLSDFSLARKLGISRTPVRQAITQLAREGLVEHRPGQGYYVCLPSREEIEEIYDMRCILECYATARVAANASPGAIERLEQTIEQSRKTVTEARHAFDRSRDSELGRAFLSADTEFHRVVIHATNSQRIIRITGELSLDSACLKHAWKNREHDYWSSMIASYRDHRRILNAIKKGQAQKAKLAMRAHILSGKHSALKVYDERCGRLRQAEKKRKTTKAIDKDTSKDWERVLTIISA